MESKNEIIGTANIVNDSGSTSVAMNAATDEYFRVSMNLSEYRTFEAIPEQAWRYIDNVVIRAVEENLIGIADLRSTPGIPLIFDGMASSVYTRRTVSRSGSAVMAPTPDVRASRSTQDFKNISAPVVVTYADYKLNDKVVRQALSAGLPLDTIAAEEAAISVTKLLEDTLFNHDQTWNGVKLQGYTKHQYRNQHTISTSWSTVAPDKIFADVNDMVAILENLNFNGPYMLYINKAYKSRLNEDYLTETSSYPTVGTIRDRLMRIEGMVGIKSSSSLATDNVVLVNLDNTTITLIEGMPIVNVAWDPPGTRSWDKTFKVMTMTIPFILSDYYNVTGIVHGHT